MGIAKCEKSDGKATMHKQPNATSEQQGTTHEEKCAMARCNKVTNNKAREQEQGATSRITTKP
jgi:hypothetical protein